MSPADWNDPHARAVTIALVGSDEPDRGDDGSLLADDDFLLLVNGWRDTVVFTLPPGRTGQRWTVELKTADPHAGDRPTLVAGDGVPGGPESMTVLRSPNRGPSSLDDADRAARGGGAPVKVHEGFTSTDRARWGQRLRPWFTE